jgi:hypothetical protein
MSTTDDFFFGRLNHVTTQELVTALAETSPVDKYEDRARRMFAAITKSREKPKSTPREDLAKLHPTIRGDWWTAKNITVDELDEALQRTGWSPWPGLPVVVSDILTHREPVWHDDEVVKDAEGVIWRNRFGSWIQFGSSRAFAPDVPKRPLKKIEV